MNKYKIVRHKGLGNWFVYKRYLFFFWDQKNYFMTQKEAFEYIGKECCKVQTV